MAVTRRDLAERLSSAADSPLEVPEARSAPQHLVDVVAAAVAGERAADVWTVVEPFDGGALVSLVDVEVPDRCVVAVVGPDGVEAAMTTDDPGEAGALYAGLAGLVGILGESCEVCGAPIPAVYQFCENCV